MATWQIGRTRPVTPRDIAESGLVPRELLDTVTEIVAQEQGNSSAVLERLRKTEGIDEETVDRLESWLIAERFVTTSAPLERDDIRTRVLASVTGDIERGLISLTDVEEVLSQLPR